jgi:hypothetical protein
MLNVKLQIYRFYFNKYNKLYKTWYITYINEY